MGRWLDALKKRENGHEVNPQNPQNSSQMGFEGFEASRFADLQKNSEPEKNAKTAQRRTDRTDKNTETPFLSVPSGAKNENFSPDQEIDRGSQRPQGKPKQESERSRIIPFPGVEWSPDTKPKPDDPERYADALRAYGPMTYGMAMRVLGWGATRAGQAEDTLRKMGRVTFDKFGRAVLKTEDKRND